MIKVLRIISYTLLGGLTYTFIKCIKYNITNHKLKPMKMLFNYGSIIGLVSGIMYNQEINFLF